MPREIKRGDTYPALTGSVSDASGPVDLSGASVVVLGKAASLPLLKLAASPVNSPTTGQWSHTWNATETATAGLFEAEVEVAFNASQIQTFPNAANTETFTIIQDLGGA